VGHYQHIILGTGQATGTLLGHLLATGDSIAVIEGGRIGGTCANTGCTPTKALVASARVAHTIRRSSDFGIRTAGVEVDYEAVRARMNTIRDTSGMDRWIATAENITLFREWGEFIGPKEIRVGQETITGDRIYINAGARSRIPPIPGLDSVPWLDNTSILELSSVPEHLIVLGGSYIGLEFAQIFRRFGAKVTVIEWAPQLIAREDADIGEAIKEILELEGIEFIMGSKATQVRPSGSNVEISLALVESDSETCDSEGTEKAAKRSVKGSHLLLAVGRVPNTDRIGVKAGDLEIDDRGYIQVDDRCQTSVKGVFALGDINGHGAFTHTAVNDAEIVVDGMRGGTRKISDRIPVYGLFIDPALGRVGLTEKQAIANGHRVLRATRPMSRIGRAKEMGETLGFAKFLVDADTDRILGAAILGPGGDEIINMIATFMYTGLPWTEYRKTVLVHPTVSELMPWILDGLKPIAD